MKFFKRTFTYLFISVFLLITSCNQENITSEKITLKFISEEYKPFNYSEDSKPTGIASELLEEICDKLNITYEIEFKEWEEGYNETLNNENTVLFSTVLNSTRKDKFKWAGPFATLEWYFYSAFGNSVALKDMNDARTIRNIGVIKGYAIDEYLVGEGFANLVYCTDVMDGFNKLLNGEIDLFPSDKFTMESAMVSLQKTVYAVTPELTIKTELLYFAFNKSVSDAIIDDFQEAIDLSKKDGTLKSLTERYLNTSDFPDIIQIYTEPYQPLTFIGKNGEVSGYGTDVLKEIMKRNHDYYNINMSSWSNGYQLALNNPNFCLYTMDRTEIRENLFQWVGPIGTNTTWFYTKAGSGITINSLDDAKNLASIGTVSSWFSTQYLQEKEFSNLVFESDPKVLVNKLLSGEVDAFVCTDITFPDILKDLGYEYKDVNTAFSLMSSDFYIAFSKNTSSEIVYQWQSALDALKLDGTYEAIHSKWFP